MSTAKPLEPSTFPLWGSRLIEASAGTGKTWTIATLYLRLVLGHGIQADALEQRTAYGPALVPGQILVMTFTRAATRELSDRIRERLLDAAQALRDTATEDPPDEFLKTLQSTYPIGEARSQAAWQLHTAAQAMDDAAVMTIDAWCQKVLHEHAFETGHPFDETLLAQEGPLIAEAIQDYWRQQVYPLEGEALATVCATWKDAEALRESLSPMLKRTRDWPIDPRPLSECAQHWIAVERENLARLSLGWTERVQAMTDWYQSEVGGTAGRWDRRKLSSNTFAGWMNRLATWAANPVSNQLGLSETALRALTPEGIRSIYKGDQQNLRLPPFLEEFVQLSRDLKSLRPLSSSLREHAAGRVVERLEALKQQARSFSFADMTRRLESALTGPSGSRLRQRIIDRFPVAMIDEFQDSSPEQYRLFNMLYRCADNDPATALILIGDPKQSIYGFRGADIFSYLKARSACKGRIYALDTNRRSTVELVDAVNAWFEGAEQRIDREAQSQGADGAFRFRRPDDDRMPFSSARAAGLNEIFSDRGGPIPALTIQYDLQPTNGTRSRTLFAARCAEQIVRWLNDEQVGFRDRSQHLRRLRPADITILVKDHHEARSVREALRERGLASIFQSEQASVFATIEASDMLHWLRAVSSPDEPSKVRAALATSTLGLPLDDLASLSEDEDAYDLASVRIRRLRQFWQAHGVLAMLRRLLHEFDCPARWRLIAEGERRLTNVLHLAELLQQASVEVEGEQPLIRWLAEQIEQRTTTPGDDQVLRLESDADLIQVITIHKSKGLAYDLVFLPFACAFRRVETASPEAVLSLVDDDGERTIAIDVGDAQLAQADLERLREDLRLFYVALTRARFAVWMGFASLHYRQAKACQTRFSAPGYLLAGTAGLEGPRWHDALEAFATRVNRASEAEAADDVDRPAAGPRILLEPAPHAPSLTRLSSDEFLPPLVEPPVYAAPFERWWSPGSYTSLTRDAEAPALARLLARRPAEDERPVASIAERAAAEVGRSTLPTARGWHRFPGGARAGDFIHGVLEWLATEQFDLRGKSWMDEALRARCLRSGHSAHADDLIEWMRALLGTKLPALGAPLSELRSRISEMEFWMPVESLQARAVDRLCRRYLLGGMGRPELPVRTLRGMLMGYADLVFEHQGRYWVLDYKTNRPRVDSGGAAPLGAAAYGRSALASEMARHRYDVQAAIYLLALHRQLRSRLGSGYAPHTHLGGAIYWFIRGIDGSVAGEYAILADPGVIELLEALDQSLGVPPEALG